LSCLQAEIEHFVNPQDKSHPKFSLIADKVLTLFPADNQLGSGRTINMSVGEAVSTGLVNNQTLGYFLARTALWAEKIGVNPAKMRFRQHLKTEMAHYAADCWDLEIHLSYGWIECVGHADRACYDLTQHADRSGVPMVASMRLPSAITVDRMIIEPNKKSIGPRFKGDQKTVITALESADDEECQRIKSEMETSGQSLVAGFLVTSDLVEFKMEKKTITEVKYTPSVIEPSFGIGRLIHSVLEHSFSQREGDENRCVMRFRPCVAPIKVGIFRLVNNPDFDAYISTIHSSFQAIGLVVKVDSSSGTVGRRYARADELGIPFGVTIDFQTLLDDSVTVRDRDTMGQIRVHISSLTGLMSGLISEALSWSKVITRYPVVAVSAADDEEETTTDVTTTAASSSTDEVLFVERSFRASFSRPTMKSNSK
jgi:glycyl-tRNA synthetase